MAKFKFRFESLLNVREIQKRKIQQEISLIDIEIENTKKQLIFIMDEREIVRRNILINSSRVSDFQNAKLYEKQLGDIIDSIQRKIEKLEEKKAAKNLELIERKKEVRTFEILKEKSQMEYLDEQKKDEMKNMNEIAIRRFAGEQR
jgi:flagellar export protein FliJ